MPPGSEDSRTLALLVAKAQSGDRAALDRILRTLQEPLYRHVLAILRDTEISRDVLQDVLFTVCRNLGQLRDPRWFRAWSYRIATREAVRRARRANAGADRFAGDEPLDSIEQPPGDEPPESELLARLPALLGSLSPASEIVLRMHYLEGLRYAEIAEALEISVGTVKSRLAYGLASLRRSLKIERSPRSASRGVV